MRSLGWGAMALICAFCSGSCGGTGGEAPSQPPAGMVLVPAVEFSMGIAEGRGGSPDERPEHAVYLDGFYVDTTEVTVAAYESCVEAGSCSEPGDESSQCNSGKPDRTSHPVNCVDWSQAKAYCEWSGKRLPTEAEWEKAARGTDGRDYPWGNARVNCEYAVVNEGAEESGCGLDSTSPAGSKPDGASPYGALDMIGNVAEWVSDWYGQDYYAESPARNPQGPASGESRVTRGGSFVSNTLYASYLQASNRDALAPTLRSESVGFRCVRGIP